MTLQAGDPRSLFYRKPWPLGYSAAAYDRLFAADPDRISVPSLRSLTEEGVVVVGKDGQWLGFAVPKPTRVSDPAWLDEIRTMRCCVCAFLGVRQMSRTEPNHTETRGAGGGDDSAAPMCRKHHDLWHILGRETFAGVIGIDPRDVAKRMWADKRERAF